ncbi:hypothetical protein Tco_1358695 [Tanacetum coccineum]
MPATAQSSQGNRMLLIFKKQMLIAQNQEAGTQLTQEEFDFIDDACAYEEIERVNANYTLEDNLQQASTSGTQTDNALVYDSDESAEQYTELLEPIPELHKVQQNDSNVISVVFSVEQSRETVEQQPENVEETRALYDSLYNNLAIEVEKVNLVNRKLRETNADLTTKLARYKNQEKCFKISQEKYDKLERCYQKSIYQEQCLTKKINALHLSSAKQITTLNEEIVNLNNQLSKEKSTVSFLQEERKKLKNDFKTREDELLDKQIQLDNKIKELDNILVKTEAAKFVRDFQSLAKEADESLAKHKALELEIERLLRAVVSQDIMSIVQNNSVVNTSNLQTELERTKERFENCIIKKENEYVKPWNDWYKKCEECKYDKISYDKAYNDMQQKIEWLQAQLGDQKGKSKDTPCVLNYAKENAHLKTIYKNLFDSIKVTQAQTKEIIDSLQDKLHDTIYENAKLRAQLFHKVSEQKDTNKGTSVNTQFSKQSILGKPPSSSKPKIYSITPFPKSTVIPKVGKSNALSKPVTSNSAPSSCESTAVNNERVIAPGIFRINPFKASRYVNGMKSRTKNQSANVSKSANQKKHKPRVWKPKKVGSKERLASPKPSTPRSCLRWSPTGRMFDLKGKIIKTSEFVCQSDCSKGDNACTSNPQEPIKRFPSSTFSMTDYQNWLDTLLIPFLFEYKPKDKENHGDNECDS